MPDSDQELTPEVMEAFVRAVKRVEKRRKILLGGYLLALIVLVVGLALALVVVGRAGPGRFVNWVLLVPLALVGVVFWIFGHWAKKIR